MESRSIEQGRIPVIEGAKPLLEVLPRAFASGLGWTAYFSIDGHPLDIFARYLEMFESAQVFPANAIWFGDTRLKIDTRIETVSFYNKCHIVDMSDADVKRISCSATLFSQDGYLLNMFVNKEIAKITAAKPYSDGSEPHDAEYDGAFLTQSIFKGLTPFQIDVPKERPNFSEKRREVDVLLQAYLTLNSKRLRIIGSMANTYLEEIEKIDHDLVDKHQLEGCIYGISMYSDVFSSLEKQGEKQRIRLRTGDPLWDVSEFHVRRNLNYTDRVLTYESKDEWIIEAVAIDYDY